jgi:[protein-PII] uridylyltransferase
LLTVVDLSTTSPTSMTKWKSHMMDELFLITEQTLTGSQASDSARLSTIKSAVARCWAPGDDLGFLAEYLRTMPEGYLLSNGPEEIACHARVALRGKQTTVTAAMVPSRRAEVTELCVVTGDRFVDPLCIVTPDRPGILASISAAITANGFDVHAAQIHSRRASDGSVQAVDLFWITDRRHDEDESEAALKKLERDLQNVITGAVAPEELLKRRTSGRHSERPAPAVATEVVLDNHASASQTLVEVTTRDRPGLLFTLSRAFHGLGLTIAVAKINTEGTRVLDVFYVTELDGRKVAEPARMADVRQALLGVLRGTTAANQPVVAK